MAERREAKRDCLRLDLLRSLQQDSDRPNKDYASELGVDQSSLSRLRDRLKREGYIKQYKAILDPGRFGLETLAFIKIALRKTDRKEADATVQFLLANPLVQEAHSIEGDFDMFIKVRLHSNKEVLEFIQNTLMTHANIKDTNLMLVLATHKENADIDI